MPSFFQALAQQRRDDHRYYHRSRINQSLHFFSACSFIAAYATFFKDAAAAALIGWLLAMVSRQTGHFFFEPKTYDDTNNASHEHKEAIKIGYNLHRKAILHVLWALLPLLLWVNPTFLGVFAPHTDGREFVRQVGTLWLTLGIGALLFRTVHLFFLRDVQTGFVWLTKILTDPFNDLKLYCKSPLYLLRGELIDPMTGKSAA